MNSLLLLDEPTRSQPEEGNRVQKCFIARRAVENFVLFFVSDEEGWKPLGVRKTFLCSIKLKSKRCRIKKDKGVVMWWTILYASGALHCTAQAKICKHWTLVHEGLEAYGVSFKWEVGEYIGETVCVCACRLMFWAKMKCGKDTFLICKKTENLRLVFLTWIFNSLFKREARQSIVC